MTGKKEMMYTRKSYVINEIYISKKKENPLKMFENNKEENIFFLTPNRILANP